MLPTAQVVNLSHPPAMPQLGVAAPDVVVADKKGKKALPKGFKEAWNEANKGGGKGVLAMAAAFALGASPTAVVVLLCLYMGTFSLGVGPFTWLVVSEITPLRYRARCMTLTVDVHPGRHASTAVWAASHLVTTMPSWYTSSEST